MTTDSLLSTPGVLSRICSFCGMRELKQLAITSKALSAPAVRVIWHTLPSFVPLVYTLPPDAWRCRNTRVDNVRFYFITQRTFILRRPLVPADFAHLRVYAPLVKVVAEPSDIAFKDVLSPNVWRSFLEHDIGSLFDIPFIHYVSLSPLEETQQPAEPIHHFIGPSLLKFYFTLQGGKDYEDIIEDSEGLQEAKPDPVLLDILMHLSTHCLRLRNFELEATPFPLYAADALSAAVCRWSHLRSFEAYTCPLSPKAWKHLAALPLLRVLNVFVDLPTEVLTDALVPGPHDPLVFPVLRELTLHARHLKTCTALIEIIESITLAKISLYAYAHASPADIERVCSALAICISHDSIQELLIKPGCTIHDPHCPTPSSPPDQPDSESAPGPRAPPRPHDPLPQAALEPLLSLRSLRQLSLLGPCFSALHNATLAAMANTLPHLWTAALCPDAAPAAAGEPGVTLGGLGVLAPLKKLSSIRLPLADVDERAVADAFFRQRKGPAEWGAESCPHPTESAAGLFAPAAAPAPALPPDNNDGGQDQGSGSASRLRCITVGRARIAEECVEGAAAALSAWFPRLTATNFTGVDLDRDSAAALRAMGFRGEEEVGEVKRRWERVGAAVGAFAVVRTQERRSRAADLGERCAV